MTRPAWNLDYGPFRGFYRDPENGWLFGVCAGIADRFNLNLVGLRLVAGICLFVFTWLTVLLYVAAALLIREQLLVLGPCQRAGFLAQASGSPEPFMNARALDNDRRFRRSADCAMLGGVCAGLADYFGFNVRATWLLAVVGFFINPLLATVAYLAAVMLVPADSTRMGPRVVDPAFKRAFALRARPGHERRAPQVPVAGSSGLASRLEKGPLRRIVMGAWIVNSGTSAMAGASRRRSAREQHVVRALHSRDRLPVPRPY